MKKTGKNIMALCLILMMCSAFFAGCSLFGEQSGTVTPTADVVLTSPVVITEIMSNNKSVLQDGDGEYSDWIELYNTTSGRINLQGYFLSDNENKPQKWELPSVYIEAHGYLVIFASGKNKSNPAKNEYHTNFSISASSGETITLVDASGSVVSRIEMPPSQEDISVGMVMNGEDAGKYMWFAQPTPGAINSGSYAEKPSELQYDTVKLFINEFMNKNTYTLYDADGDYNDWLELYNPNTEAVDLSGFYLSDNETNFKKWQFPQGTQISAGGYLVVFASGKDKKTDTELHAGFKLGKDDTVLILSDAHGRRIDSIALKQLPENISYGREGDAWKYFAKPTPGAANAAQGFDELSAAAELINRGVWIKQVSAVADGSSSNSYDKIVLYNGTEQPVDLLGYGLSKSLLNLYRYKFPDVTIESGKTLTIYASGGTPSKPASGALYLPFKISTSGEELYLTDAEGFVVDAFESGKLRGGVSSGRSGTLLAQRVFFYSDQPEQTFSGYAPVACFSREGGYAREQERIELSVPAGCTARYTLDGSEPTEKSSLYIEPIVLTKSVTIRVKTFAEGLLPGDCVSETYLVEEPHAVDILCISGDPKGFFSEESGIFATGSGASSEFPYKGANYWQNWERAIYVEYFGSDGMKRIAFPAGLKIFGQYSRAEAQKSMAIQVRDDYGAGTVTYPFFNDNRVTTFKSFVLRTSGQDWYRSKLRDAFVAQVIKGETELAVMDSRPVAVYLNGEYFGLYNLREKINEAYLASHYGYNEDEVTIIKGNSSALAGTNREYKALIDYVSKHDLRKAEYYDYVCSQVNTRSLIEWWVMTTWFVNTDSGNIKCFKGGSEGDKWTWVIFDMDWMLFPTTYDWNYLKKVYANGHGVGSGFSTVLIKGLLQNDNFKKEFISVYSYHVKNTLNLHRTYAILDTMAAEIRPEIPRQYALYGKPSTTTFERNITQLKQFMLEKVELTKKHFQEVFGLSKAEAEELFGVDITGL